MYDPVIGRFVLDNWDKVIAVLQKPANKKSRLNFENIENFIQVEN